jgi:asparagine synthase (glutamine-hydrolysing)
MCGIFVAFNKGGLTETETKYNDFLKLIQHRGPDSSERYISNEIYMGFNRLKILDLSSNANMPMFSKDERYVLVFNGEIYNYKELKKEFLEDFDFKSSSDSEVILAGYQKYGLDFFEKMSGMWALLIYDTLNQKVIISRDRLGLKPLYYLKLGEEYYFSSEQKSLIEVLESKKENLNLNVNYAVNYIIKGNCDFKNETFYENIFLIEEGSIYELSDELRYVKKIWEIKFSENENFSEKNFSNILINSFIQHTNSHVKVSTTLSSGIDSSTIFFTLKKFFQKELKSFSLKFSLFQDDESEIIKNRVKKFNISNQMVEVNQSELKEKFDFFLDMMDEPFVSDNLFYQSLLTKEVKEQNFKVLLVGDGADEFFCGYDKFYFLYFFHLLKNLYFIKALKFAFKNKINIKTTIFFKKAFSYFILGEGKRGVITNKFGKKIINNELYSKLDKDVYKINKKFPNILEEEIFTRFKFDVIKFNKNSDISGMMNSVEVRLPYLDHRLVDYLLNIDKKLNFKNYKSKSILKEFSQLFLPKEISEQEQKFKKPGSTSQFVYKVLDKDIVDYLKLNKNSKIFKKDLLDLYLKNKSENDTENSFIWFRYYQINKLINLKKIQLNLV